MARDSGPAHIKSIRDVAAQYNDGVVQQSTSPPASISDLRAAHRREQPLLGGQLLDRDSATATHTEIPALRGPRNAPTARSGGVAQAQDLRRWRVTPHCRLVR